MGSETVLLVESAVGYALFNSSGIEEIGSTLAAVRENLESAGAVKRGVTLRAFKPFADANEALENTSAIQNGELHADLSNFLENSAKGCKLVIADKELASAIHKQLGNKVKTGGPSVQLLHACHRYLPNFIPGVTAEDLKFAQLGIGHSIARHVLKTDPNQQDKPVTSVIAIIDELDKYINTLGMRLREWFSYNFPELIKIISDPYRYASAVLLLLDYNFYNIQESEKDRLRSGLVNAGFEEEADRILLSCRSSTGYEFLECDTFIIKELAKEVTDLHKHRSELLSFLQKRLSVVAPNLAALIGDIVAARLLAHAGSLSNLTFMPASTIQILGAEKALFRALKEKSNTPKYGLLFNSSYVTRAAPRDKGRIARFLANKCSIASRLDKYSLRHENQVLDAYGVEMRKQCEERLLFITQNIAPRTNAEVLAKAKEEINRILEEERQSANLDEEIDENVATKSSHKKKEKSSGRKIEESDDSSSEVEECKPKKRSSKSKKEKRSSTKVVSDSDESDDDRVSKRSKKRSSSKL